jgi:D-3-phosphoglycerate dehydrogenase
VLAWDPKLSAQEISARGCENAALDELLRQSDFVSVSCALTEDTRALIGAREFALMPKHACFINTARGGIHDEAALAQALHEGGIAGAGLDVWEPEPPPLDHPLLQFDNVVATPHIAGATHESRRITAMQAAQQLIDVLDGKRPPHLLNPQVWPAFAKRFERAFGYAPAA